MRISRVVVLAAVAALVGCKGGNVSAVQPTLVVIPDGGFPLTAFGASATLMVTLESTTGVDVLTTVAIDGGAFSVTPTGAVTVPGEQTTVLTVTFTPPLPSPVPSAVQSFNGALSVASNDPNNPFTNVPLHGTAQAPELDLCSVVAPDGGECLSQGPVTVDFGMLSPRQMAGPFEIDVKDLAEVPLTVTNLALDTAATAAGYALTEMPTLPFTLSAQQGLTEALHVTLTPQMSGTTVAGNLVVTSDDPRLDGGVAEVALTASVKASQPPIACIGIAEIDYITGEISKLDAGVPLADQPQIVPPGPLDTVILTAEVSDMCSLDPQDGQNLSYAFALDDPTGSQAADAPVTGHPEETKVQFDVIGDYLESVTATDSASLSAMAQLAIPVAPQSDIEAQLTWGDGGHQIDLDLHLVRQLSSGTTASLVDDPQNDCYWCNCLLSDNYPQNQSPCQGFPTSLQWSSVGSPLAGNPLLVANQGYQPLPSANFDDIRLNGPVPGATYGLFAHYYQTFASGGPGACMVQSDCNDPVYSTCWGGECVPSTSATLRIYVAGNDIFDGGPSPTTELHEPCDLWHAGDIQWLAGGHLPDGGFLPPAFNFVAATVDGGVSNNSAGAASLVCDVE